MLNAARTDNSLDNSTLKSILNSNTTTAADNSTDPIENNTPDLTNISTTLPLNTSPRLCNEAS